MAHVAASQLETIPASEYAKRHGLAVKSLYYWRRKLSKSDKTDAALPAGKFVALRIAPGGARAHWRCHPACAWKCQRYHSPNGSQRWCVPCRECADAPGL